MNVHTNEYMYCSVILKFEEARQCVLMKWVNVRDVELLEHRVRSQRATQLLRADCRSEAVPCEVKALQHQVLLLAQPEAVIDLSIIYLLNSKVFWPGILQALLPGIGISEVRMEGERTPTPSANCLVPRPRMRFQERSSSRRLVFSLMAGPSTFPAFSVMRLCESTSASRCDDSCEHSTHMGLS